MTDSCCAGELFPTLV